MFKETYQFFGEELVCHVLTTNSFFAQEKDSYTYMRSLTTKAGYKYLRIDTTGQIGFPDILILKEKDYCLIEAKRLDNKKLVVLEDNLKWQYGQVAFAVRSFTLNLSYVLAVCKENKLAFIGQEQTICQLKRTILT